MSDPRDRGAFRWNVEKRGGQIGKQMINEPNPGGFAAAGELVGCLGLLVTWHGTGC